MNLLVLWLFLIYQKIIPVFPLKFLYFMVKVKAVFFYYILPIRKKVAFINLKLAFPDKPNKEIKKIIKGCYLNVLTVIVEYFYMKKFTIDEINRKLEIKDIGRVYEKLKLGKGIILVSAHFGNWEFLAFCGAQQAGVPFNIIVKEQTNKKMDGLLNAVREGKGNKMIEMKKAPREILKALARNEVVAMLGDQSAPAESVKVIFFGMEVTAFEGPAVFALKTHVPVFWGVPFRNPDHTYTINLFELDLSKYEGYNRENIQALTQEMITLLEKHICMKPDHWLWFHKRFKSVISYD